MIIASGANGACGINSGVGKPSGIKHSIVRTHVGV